MASWAVISLSDKGLKTYMPYFNRLVSASFSKFRVEARKCLT
jgi:hypothetical protein